MKISFDSLNANQNVDRVTTSQKSDTASGTKPINAFALDISGTVMDNRAYEGQGTTAEDVMQIAEQDYMSAQQDFMTVMSHFMSAGDYQELEENGFKPGSMPSDEMITVVDEIKAKLAEAGITITGYNDDLTADELAKITGSDMRGRQIAASLRKNDIPVNRQNVHDVGSALEKCVQITELSDGAKKYLIKNHCELNIKEIYKAQFSASSMETRQGYGYYADDMPGYYAKKADSFQWDHLEGRMREVIDEAGLDVNEETMQEARWIVEQGIPLTGENLMRLDRMNDIPLPMPFEKAMDAMMNALWNKQPAETADLTVTESIVTRADRILNEVAGISGETLERAVESGEPLTIRNLLRIQEQETAGRQRNAREPGQADRGEENREQTDYRNREYEMITARRRLEEVRLMMTFEANLKLLKSGYQIETAELSQLVEELKASEENTKQLLFGTKDPDELQIRDSLYQDTLTKVAQIGEMPAQVIGKVIDVPAFYHLNYIHTQGTVLKSTYENVNAAYETVMTVPRADLGDNIRKAFRNVEEILAGLNLKPDEANERAVRILGYNSMMITEENINRVKAADLQLNRVIRKLTPGATLKLIRDGINPLTMNLEELENHLNGQENRQDDAERYSRFLYKLEKNNRITPQEKESFIGIYRLLRQVEKSDGAVIGSLVNQGAEVNFKNLLTALRTGSDRHMEYTIDDTFGGVDGSYRNGNIEDQISSYYNHLARDIYERLEPETMAGAGVDENMTLDRLHEAMNQNPKQISPETEQVERLYRTEQLEEIRSVRFVSESTLDMLMNYDQTISADTLLAADYLMQYRGAMFRQIFGYADKAGSRMQEETEQAMYKLQRNLTDHDSAVTAYDNLVETAGDVLERITDTTSGYIDVRSITNFHKQLHVAGNLAKKDNYEVPVKINGEINSINLQIVHNGDDKGKVQITFEADYYGKVYASFQVQQKNDRLVVTGMIAGNSEEGLHALRKLEPVIRNELTSDVCTVDELYYTTASEMNLNRHEQTAQGTDNVTTKTLFEISKAFIIAIQSQKGDEAYED